MKNNFSFIFYIYYVLVLVLTLGDLFVLHETSTSIYFALASAFLGIILHMFYLDNKKQKEEIVDTLTSIPNIELYHEEQFYSTFRFTIKNSTQNVDITHLALDSPLGSRKSEQKSYYSEFVKIVKEKHLVNFRRVERLSERKIAWIEVLLKDFAGVNNFSLYAFLDPLDKRENELSDFISVQRVDSDHTFIVALLQHTSTIGKRDIYIRDKAVTDFFREYYQKRLVDNSIALIVQGRINQLNWEKLKKDLL